MRDFKAVPPDQQDLMLEVKSELVANTDVNALAEQMKSSIPGLVVNEIVNLPDYKAIIVKGTTNGNSLGQFAQRFVDSNPLDSEAVGERATTFGHTTQVTGTEPMTETDSTSNETLGADNQTAMLSWNQTLTYGLERSTSVNDTLPQYGITATSSNDSNPLANDSASLDNNTSANGSFASNANSLSDVDVAVLDTGISLNHPDLNVYRNVSFVNGTISGDDDQGHGSHVAGIAAAKDNDIGIVGIAPGARLWAIKVCDGAGECRILNQIKGIEYAIEHADEIDVLNISIENKNSASLNRVIDQAVKAGITVVVAAGNYGRDASSTSPANDPNVITVSAIADTDGKCGGLGPSLPDPEVTTIKDDTFAYFSNFGPVVKIAAPGVDILSTINGTDYGIESGTSMATPHVTGAAALYKLEKPDASPSEVMSMVLNSGSTPKTLCHGGSQGYFTGDVDTLNEPLLFRDLSTFR
jgi:subtilisin family serine protease